MDLYTYLYSDIDILRGTLGISSDGYLHKIYRYVYKHYDFNLKTKKWCC